MADFNLEMVSLPRIQVEKMLHMMQLSEGYCRKARPFSMYDDDAVYAEPTEFFSGASGYAGATLREAIQTLETYL